MGLTAPWLQNVQELAAQMPWPTEVVVNVNDMARRMADSDLAIGAAGGTSWERCCLGLPTLMVVLADNQKDAAEHLQKASAAVCLAFSGLLYQDLHDQLRSLIDLPDHLHQVSSCASAITDGLGVDRMVSAMTISLSQSN
jgi:UDP-2,4-diacetamido-2,4,6-trideoxy-beta-L-altropyranose hydrolase